MNPTASSIVPFAPPNLGPLEIAEVLATLESGWLTTGPRVASFERRFADYVARRMRWRSIRAPRPCTSRCSRVELRRVTRS